MGITAGNTDQHNKDISMRGALTERFQFGAFAEQHSANDDNFDQWLSMDVIQQAEWSLGHILDDRPQIEHAVIAHNDNAITYLFDHKIAPYSVDDTITEQNTVENSDANLSTASGYLKKQLFDPTAHAENLDIKRRKDWDLVKTLDEHEQEMARLAALIEKLESQIEAIDVRIAVLDKNIEQNNQRLEDINELADFAEGGGDVRNLSAVKQRRLNNLLAAQGRKLDDYNKPDGSIDNDALARDLREMQKREENTLTDLEAQRAREQARRDELDRQLQEHKKEYNALKDQRDQNIAHYNTALESGDEVEIANARQTLEKENTAQSVQLLSEQEKLDKIIEESSPELDEDDQGGLSLDSFKISLFDGEDGNFLDTFDIFGDDEDKPETQETAEKTQTKDTGIGSVAATTDDTAKLISAEFSRKVNVEVTDTTVTALDIKDDHTTKNDDVYAAKLPTAMV